MVQHLLRWLPTRRLVLRGVFAPRLNLREMPGVDTLDIRGGTISWLDLPARCPDGQAECADDELIRPDRIVLRDLPIADPRQVELLASLTDSFEGSILTPDEWVVASASRTVVDELFAASREWTAGVLRDEWSPFPSEFVPDRAKIQGLQTRGVVPGTFSCERRDDYLGEPYQVGPFATWTEQEGLVLVGEFGSRARGKLAPGLSQQEVEEAFPGALLSTPSHTVWADGDRVQLVAVFDEDGLKALVVPQGCWVEYLVDEIRRRNEGEGESGE
jgi:hypothetical protein